MTANPAEVVLTSRKSAKVQRALAGVSIVAALAGGVALVFSDQPWWAIVLWELGILFTVLFLLAIWSSAASDAQETAALVAAGTKVLGEVVDNTRYDETDTVYHLLTVWIPLRDGGFQARHRCGQAECTSLEPGGRLTVLVDPAAHTWAVLH
ncbi:hypothetical protein SK803_03095 [Lentzea sp. BCCO 10_0856]|uniref:Uncharacterized protein n=1 Tax=Lentzea miocenica TaxID=3095431 RepID=A0ABU4STD9_9PSEU|nr:hypothetical protein [Lentzea sp. BCCO 10_0856]MDX8029177.1 hypothetical protein [Lentzea sp. BCCO 10_0856]